MSEVQLPTDWEELGNLIESGEMTEDQISQIIDIHIHNARDCEVVCLEIWNSFESRPIELVIENYANVLTLSQRKKIYEDFEDHLAPIEDSGARAFARTQLLDVSLGASADFAMLKQAASDYYLSIEAWHPDDGSLTESTQALAVRFASHPACTEEVLEILFQQFHEGGLDLNCTSRGELSSCGFCAPLLKEAIVNLKD